ncbi:MAG: hypothetical protein ACRDQA_25525 [Nocardioidaceae bacterium]
MPDDRRLETFARDATRRVVAPEFDDLVRTVRRRRRAGMAATGVTVAAIVGVAFAGVQGVYDDQGAPSPVPPAHSGIPTSTATTSQHHSTTHDRRPLTAEQIVQDPKARLLRLAVSATNPGSRASVWNVAGAGVFAVVVTNDGFTTRHYVRLHKYSFPTLTAVGQHAFFVSDHRRGGSLLSDTGALRPVEFSAAPGPLAKGEVLVDDNRANDTQHYAVDPVAATAHPLSTPEDLVVKRLTDDGNQLSGVGTTGRGAHGDTAREVWSVDGGASWSSHHLGRAHEGVWASIPTGDQSMAVVRLEQPNALAPTILRSRDGSAWHTVTMSWQHSQWPLSGWQVVRPDGSLLLSAATFGHGSGGTGSGVGLYESEGDNWSHLKPVHPSLPNGTKPDEVIGDLVLAQESPTGTQTLYLSVGADNAHLLVSTDGGHSWTTTPAR